MGTSFLRWSAALSVGLLGLSQKANAAKITWASSQTINGPSDVSTQGSSVYAYSLGNSTSPIVNGVTFTAAASNNGNPDYDFTDSNVLLHNYIYYGGFNAPPTVSDSNYSNLLSNAGYAPGSTNVMTFTLKVVVNQQYQIQVWANDARGPQFAATESISDPSGGAGNIILSQNYTNGYGGSYVTGTFTANSTNQQVSFVWANGDSNQTAQINAFQLRNVTPTPEPATAMLGLGALGLMARRRKTK